METVLKGRKSVVYIAPGRPTVLIGKRINRSVRRRAAGYLEVVENEALAQVAAGADVIHVTVDTAPPEQGVLLPRVVEVLQETVEVPLSLETSSPAVLAATLAVYQGKPLITAVNGEERCLREILPVVARYGTVVVGRCLDERGLPDDPYKRLEIAARIVSQAESLGIPHEDVLIDCGTQPLEINRTAALVTLETIRLVRDELGCNMTLDVSAISSELPNCATLYQAFLLMGIAEGVTAPFVDVARDRQAILALDVLLGRDESAMRYIKYYHYIRSGMRSLIDWELVG